MQVVRRPKIAIALQHGATSSKHKGRSKGNALETKAQVPQSAFDFLRRPAKPSPPKPATRSGKAAGRGTSETPLSITRAKLKLPSAPSGPQFPSDST